jgi:hypothetical protein
MSLLQQLLHFQAGLHPATHALLLLLLLLF